ncbi:MAG: response regulator [Magnetococcus sp. DMHC-1]|nr:response regulator [Magnetococcales bacterium]
MIRVLADDNFVFDGKEIEKMGHAPSKLNQMLFARKFWVWPVLIWSLVAGLSILWNAISLNRQALALARERGWYSFRILETARMWNARHGGVYVPVTEKTPPNPYLDTANRDEVAFSGKHLTLINPAYMTRQLAEIALEKGSMVLHITSLNPIRPENVALEWESRALQGFKQGDAEYLELVREDGKDFYRFMAPLYTHAECLKCHAQQGYKIGDLRGGISLVFPAGTILEGVQEQTKNVILFHLGAWILLTGMTLWFLGWVRGYLIQLQRLQSEREALYVNRQPNIPAPPQTGSSAEDPAFSWQSGEMPGITQDSLADSGNSRQVPQLVSGKVRLLLVEDDPLNRRMLEALLQGLGIFPEVAKNGQEALDHLAVTDFDLVLMDCQMPVMDGFTASQELRQREAARGKHTPIIAVTAFALLGDAEQCQKAGMDDYLAKPVCRQDLLQLLDRWLPGWNADPQTRDPIPQNNVSLDADADQIIDPRTFQLLCSELGSDVVGEVVHLFLETLPERVQAIAKAMAEGDTQAVHWATHPLKSPSRQLGALRFSHLATELDTLTRRNSLEGAQLLADQLQKEAGRVDAALKKIASRCQK